MVSFRAPRRIPIVGTVIALLALLLSSIPGGPTGDGIAPALPTTVLPASHISPTGTGGPGPNWTGNATHWQSINTSRVPKARTQAATAYYPPGGYVVLFGGQDHDIHYPPFFNQTWTFNGTNWTLLHPWHAPAPRRGAEMVWDAKDGYLVLFGGSNGTTYFNDTWAFRGKWTQLHPPISPPARRSVAMTYDASLGKVVLFGGHGGSSVTNGSGYTIYNDTWTFLAGHWTKLTTRGNPPPTAEGQFAYDPTARHDLLFGGYNVNATGSETTFATTWVFHNRTWTNVSARLTVHPSYRDGGCLNYLPTLGALYLFGGDYQVVPVLDTWAFQNGTWKLYNATGSPDVRGANRAAWDSALSELVTFGSPSDPTTGATLGPPQTWVDVAGP